MYIHHLIMTAVIFCCIGEVLALEKPIISSKDDPKLFHPNQKEAIEYEVEKPKTTGEDFFLPRIEKIFANPSLVANLEKGADAINKSIESLMDSLFYSLLDNELRLDVSEFTWISTGMSRRVFTTERGNYVVVDRFHYGPQLLKPISEIAGIPIYFGASGDADVLEIYLRTDAQRLKETEDASWYEKQLKNWFGILPFLTRVLPPSFNPNEMYDPVRQIKNPFSFPMTKQSLKQMPNGSVRSYGLSGGVSLPIDFASRQNELWRGLFDKIGIKAQLPYGIFVTGQFRVNILKKSEDRIWIGLSQSDENGHSINPFLGGTYFLFQNAFVFLPWKGLLSQVIPIDVSYKNSLLSVFDQLFEFDLNEEANSLALEKALIGDFAQSMAIAANKKNGVIFHFNRTEASLIDNQKTNHNFFLFQDSKEIRRKKSQIRTWDEKEDSYSLEVEHIWSEDYWNILVGKESINLSVLLEMQVKKEKEDEEGMPVYSFLENKEKAPYLIRFGLQIDDKYADAFDYQKYAQICRHFTKLSLKELVEIPIRNQMLDLERSQETFFTHPYKAPFTARAPFQMVGRFDSQAVAIFSHKSLENLLSQKEEDIIEKLLELSTEEKKISKEQRIFVAEKLKNLTKLPLHLILKYELWDISLDQIKNIAKKISLVKKANTPYEYQEAFHELFKSAKGRLILDLFYAYANIDEIPRKISFDIKPSADLPAEVSHQLEKASTVSFASHKDFPKRKSYHIAKDKLEAFFPKELKDMRNAVAIDHLSISLKNEKEEEASIFVEMSVKDFPKNKKAKIYLKLEESGKLLLGKYVLGQKVLELSSSHPNSELSLKPDESYFAFYLTGTESVLSDFMFDQSLKKGGDFLLSLSISEDGQVWSKERVFRFHYENKTLSPPSLDEPSS